MRVSSLIAAGIAFSVDGVAAPTSLRASAVISCGVRMPATMSSPWALIRNGVEADQSHDDQIERQDEAQQPRHDQDQAAREEGDERRDVGNVVRVTRSIRMKFSIHTRPTKQSASAAS